MMKLLKVLGVIVALIVALVITAVVAINVIPGEQYKSIIGSVVKSATGRDLVIAGDLDIELGSSFRVSASDVSFSNAEWGTRPEMFSGGLVEGEVVLMPLLDGILDARLVLEAPDLLLETDAEGQGNWQMGSKVQEASDDEADAAEDGGFPLRPFIRELRLDQVKVAYLDGAAGQEHHADFDTILVSSQGDQVVLDLNGRLDEHPVALKGGVDNKADANPDAAPPTGFNLSGNIGDISLNASGILDVVGATADVDLVVEAQVPSLAALSAFAGRDLPDQGPLDARIHINGSDGRYSADGIDVDFGAEMLTATVDGVIADLAGLSGVELDIVANTTQLPDVVSQFGVEVPVDLPPKVDAKAKISGSLKELTVAGYEVGIEDEGVTTSATGAVDDVTTLQGVRADVSLDATSLAVLSKYAKTELPDLGPLQASASVTSEGDTYAVSDIRAELAGKDIQATVEGSLGDAIALKALDAQLQVTLVSLAALNDLAGRELPDSGPVSLTGKLASAEGLDSPSDVSGSISGDGVKASFSGSVADLLAAKGISLAVNVEGESLQHVAKLAGKEVPRTEPVSLKGNVYLGGSTYKADKLQFRLGDNEITGAAELKVPAKEGDRPAVSGTLNLGTFDLDALLRGPEHAAAVDVAATSPDADAESAEAEEAESAEPAQPEIPPDGDVLAAGEEAAADVEAAAGEPQTAQADTTGGQRDRIFPTDPLPFEALRAVDATFQITGDEVTTRQLLLRDVVAELVLTNGVLRLEPVQAAVGNGTFDASVALDASGSPANVAIDLSMDDGTFRYFGGRYSMKVDLDGTGDSVAQLMAGLDGQLILDVRELELQKSFMTKFGRSLLDTMNPFDKESDKSELVCAIVRFDITDGMADNNDKFVAQMTDVTWFGGGDINLKTEAINLGAESKPRKGLGINVVGGVAGLVQVGGTLADPKIIPDPVGVAKSYGHRYLGVATGGLYLLLKGLWDKSRANSDVCAKILEMEEKERNLAGGEVAEPDVPLASGVESSGKAAPGTDAEVEADDEAKQQIQLDVLDHR